MQKLKIINSFGEPIDCEGEIGAAKVHGYEKDGSWSLYGGPGWIPCVWIAVRWKRKRKASWVMKSSFIGFPNGEVSAGE